MLKPSPRPTTPTLTRYLVLFMKSSRALVALLRESKRAQRY